MPLYLALLNFAFLFQEPLGIHNDPNTAEAA